MTRRRTSVGALLAALLITLLTTLLTTLFAALPATAAQTDVDTARAGQALQENPLYVAPNASGVLSPQEEPRVRRALEESDARVYVAVLPQLTETQIDDVGSAIAQEVERPGTYAIVTADGDLNAASTTLEKGEAEKIAERAASNNQDDAAGALVEFVELTNQAEDNGGSLPNTAANTALLVVLAVLVLGGLGLYGFARQRRKKREAEELAQAKVAAEEDVVRLGEDVARLDLDVRDTDLDPDARRDYTQALDSYDGAKAALAAARRPGDLRQVTSALEDGRYAMTCVRARLDGRPVPERRAPCFFNPQHGPSATDTHWAPAGGTPRQVPVCAADSERLARGEDPESREVLVGGVRRPYWEAGRAYAPWAGGYYGAYGATDMFTGLLIGSALGHMMFGGWGFGDFGGGDAGAGDGGGDFGGGGFDFGGGDFGGGGFGDFGGGDF